MQAKLDILIMCCICTRQQCDICNICNLSLQSEWRVLFMFYITGQGKAGQVLANHWHNSAAKASFIIFSLEIINYNFRGNKCFCWSSWPFSCVYSVYFPKLTARIDSAQRMNPGYWHPLHHQPTKTYNYNYIIHYFITIQSTKCSSWQCSLTKRKPTQIIKDLNKKSDNVFYCQFVYQNKRPNVYFLSPVNQYTQRENLHSENSRHS